MDEAVGRLRTAGRDRQGVETTFGCGPRSLHSTRQLRNGGPPTWVFLQLVDQREEDLDVPGEPSSFREPRANGDLQTLRAHDLPVARVRVPVAGELVERLG